MTQTINIGQLVANEAQIKLDFNSKKPFRYLVLENFLIPEVARKIYEEFPAIDQHWVDANGIRTRNKWTNPCIAGTVAEKFYQEVNSRPFLEWLGRVVEIEELLPDPNLFGAGYHQITDGGFLDVHVDFNKHESNDLDRRLNLLVYLNPGWQEPYGGALELWDMEKKEQVAKILPIFNRCVIFETNEISYHGHPEPLKTGSKTTRKSLSVYYYSQGRNDGVNAAKHSTLYVNTQGMRGALKIAFNTLSETARRIGKGGIREVLHNVILKLKK
jgi:hypothetical protein